MLLSFSLNLSDFYLYILKGLQVKIFFIIKLLNMDHKCNV